ncbi:MAG: hypothetical protein RBS96_02300 [Dehalococcoidales bacterium]|jgi:hypothetical protein|nr:hypothetical protein [Dehalococcoidales bacterium]
MNSETYRMLKEKETRLKEICKDIMSFKKDTEQTLEDFEEGYVGATFSYEEYLDGLLLLEYDSFLDLIDELKDIIPWIKGKTRKVRITVEFEQFVPEGASPEIDIYSAHDKRSMDFEIKETDYE